MLFENNVVVAFFQVPTLYHPDPKAPRSRVEFIPPVFTAAPPTSVFNRPAASSAELDDVESNTTEDDDTFSLFDVLSQEDVDNEYPDSLFQPPSLVWSMI